MGKKILLTLIGGTQAGMKPIATSILSAVLKERGHDVVLFDSTFMNIGLPLDNVSTAKKLKQFKSVNHEEYGLKIDYKLNAKEEFLKVLFKEEPDIIAANSMTDMFSYTLEFLKLAKEEYKNIPIIVGGVHSTLNAEEVISHDCIDAICIGEGEEALCEFVDSVANSKITNYKIRNLWIKNGDEVVKNQLRPLVNLDSLPFLDYSIYDKRQFYRAYMGKMYIGADVEEKRGCPRKCTYCANSILNTKVYNKSRVNRYSPERFVEEMNFLKNKWEITFAKFYSEDVANINVDELAKLSALYKKHVDIPFTAGAYPLSLTREKVKLLKEMNCASISIALECGNEHYRENNLKRKYSNKLFNEKIALLNEFGIRSNVLTMIGLPYESRKMIFETIHAARDSRPLGVNCNCFFPYRGTPLGDVAIKEGFTDLSFLSKKDVRWQRGFSVLNMPQINPEEVIGIRKLWYYYMNSPKIIYPILRICEHNKIIFNILKPFIYILTNVRVLFKGRI